MAYNKLNDTLNDNDFAFKGSIFEREVVQHAKSYIQDLKNGKSDPTWPSSWGPKPPDSDYQHNGILKRLGYNPEDFADDQMQPQTLDCKSLLYIQTTMVALMVAMQTNCNL